MRKIIAWIVPILVASNLLAQTSTFTDTATSTPLPTAKNTRTVTEERSWTATPTPTPLMTATEKFTETRTPTISISYTPTISDYTETKTPTKTFATETHTDTDTPTPTYASETFTETTSPTMTVTEVVTDSHTETDTATNTVTALTTHTATSTVTPTHTITITVTPTVTATMTVTFRYNDQDIGVSDDIDFYSALGWWRLHSGPDRDGLLQVGNYLRIQDQNTWQDALVVKMADKSSTFYGSINLVGGVVNMGCAPMTNVSQVRGCGDKPLTITGIGQDVVLTGNIIQVATNMEMDGNSIESGAIYPLATNTYDIGAVGFAYKGGYFKTLYVDSIDTYSAVAVTIAGDLYATGDIVTPNSVYGTYGNFDELWPWNTSYIYAASDLSVNGAVTATAFVGDGSGVTNISVAHNDTTGKQGGTAGEYYHLTESDYAAVTLPAWIPKALIDAKGDIIVGTTDDTPARKAIGADGTGLVADDTSVDGTSWTGMPKRATMFHKDSIALAGNAKTLVVGSSFIHCHYAYQNPAADGDSFSHGCYLQEGVYTFGVIGIARNLAGTMQWTLDAVTVVSGQDWYSKSYKQNTIKEEAVTVQSTGWHTLIGLVTGKNASSSNYELDLTEYYFIPEAD